MYFRRRFYILVVSGKVSLIKVIFYFFFGRSIVLTKVSLCANFYFKALEFLTKVSLQKVFRISFIQSL